MGVCLGRMAELRRRPRSAGALGDGGGGVGPCVRRPTTDDRRPTTDDRRPTTDDRRPTSMMRVPTVGPGGGAAISARWVKPAPGPPSTSAGRGARTGRTAPSSTMRVVSGSPRPLHRRLTHVQETRRHVTPCAADGRAQAPPRRQTSAAARTASPIRTDARCASPPTDARPAGVGLRHHAPRGPAPPTSPAATA